MIIKACVFAVLIASSAAKDIPVGVAREMEGHARDSDQDDLVLGQQGSKTTDRDGDRVLG